MEDRLKSPNSEPERTGSADNAPFRTQVGDSGASPRPDAESASLVDDIFRPAKYRRRRRSKSPSLFDDAFAERIERRERKLSPWLYAIPGALVIPLALFLIGSLNGDEPDSPQPEVKGESLPVQVPNGSSSQPEAAVPDQLPNPAPVSADAGVSDTPPRPGNRPESAQSDSPRLPDPSAEPRSRSETATAGGATTREAAGDRPRLVREGDDEKPALPPEPPALSKEDAEKGLAALEILRDRSPSARKLMADLVSNLRYQGWGILPHDREEEFLIDLVATEISGTEPIHFVWGVNLRTETVQPLSQAARDLVESSERIFPQ